MTNWKGTVKEDWDLPGKRRRQWPSKDMNGVNVWPNVDIWMKGKSRSRSTLMLLGL